MIRMQNVGYKIGASWLVKNVDLQLPPGCLAGLLGPNGAGKSTLLRLMSGAIQPHEGQMLLSGVPPVKDPLILAKVRTWLGQDSTSGFAFPVEDVVLMGRLPFQNGVRNAEKDLALTRAAMATHSVSHLSHRAVTTLSGGERQRTGLARAFTQAAEGRVLLLDEPANHLDPLYQLHLMEACRNMAHEGKLVVAAMHDINLAARFASHLVLMHEGVIVAQGNAREVLTPANLRRVYGLEMEAVCLRDGDLLIAPSLPNEREKNHPTKEEQHPMSVQVTTPESLRERYAALKEAKPKLRIRDAATALGTNEAELLALGEGVRRLEGDFSELLRQMHTVGRVMTLTRNETAVHEKKGLYEPVDINGPMGVVTDKNIDLRLFMRQWKFGFAVRQEGSQGRVMESFQFFDPHGVAIHKIFLQADSNLGAYEKLVEGWLSPDQTSALEITPEAPHAPTEKNPDFDKAAFLESWSKLKDTHGFFGLLKKFKVTRLQALEIAEGTYATRLPRDAYKALLEKARDEKMPIMVFVGNRGVIQIHAGPVENIKLMDGWTNVLDSDFNLHLKDEGVGQSWLVRKPTHDGVVTSVEIMGPAGEEIALFFGVRKPGMPELPAWAALAGGLA